MINYEYKRPQEEYERQQRKNQKAYQRMKHRIEMCVVWMLTIALLQSAVTYAYIERGYPAIGGEFLVLLFPLFYKIVKAFVRDVLDDIKNGR